MYHKSISQIYFYRLLQKTKQTILDLSPYAVLFLNFFTVLADNLNDFVVGEPFDPNLYILSGVLPFCFFSFNYLQTLVLF